MMNNLRISSKLMVVFGALLALFVFSSMWSIRSLSTVNDSVSIVTQRRIPNMSLAGTVNTATSDLRSAEFDHILSTTPAAIAAAEQPITAEHKIIDDAMAELDRTIVDPEARVIYNTLQGRLNKYYKTEEQILALSRANKNVEAKEAMTSAKSMFDDLSADADKLVRHQMELAHKDATEINATYASSRLIALVILALSIIGVGAALYMLVTAIAKPITLMTGAMAKLAAGDLAAAVPDDGRKDEVGSLAKAMGMFRDQLKAAEDAKAAQTALICGSIGNGLDLLQKGDLTSRIDAELTGPFAKLKSDFNSAMTELQSVMQLVAQSTGGIHTGAGEISQASDDLSRRTEQQAASLEETAAAMDEITATVREAASNASRANSVVSETRDEVEESGSVVRKAVEAMHGIERSSNEISEIIAVIDGIAFQTNLLALNAGVEAARAGDAGKGFAVVASEVRALAQRSADAAKDVKSRITASSQQVDVGVELVSQTGKALERIIGRISEISALVSGIAASAEQQAAGLQQVNTAVGEMDSVTQQNAAMVEEATAAARSLSSEADELAAQVGRFQLGATTAVGRAPARREAPAAPPVHAMQKRAATAARRIAAKAPVASGNTALKVSEDDWSEF